jgi:hypothetical protein
MAESARGIAQVRTRFLKESFSILEQEIIVLDNETAARARCLSLL